MLLYHVKFAFVFIQEQQNSDGPFGGVCEYQLVCTESYAQPSAYPPCAHTSWGTGDSAALYPLTPLHGAGAVVETSSDGTAEIRLQMGTELRFSARLKSVNYKDEEALSRYVMTRVVADTAVFLVKVATWSYLFAFCFRLLIVIRTAVEESAKSYVTKIDKLGVN